jgi:RNA polymerase-binding transcription factor DksA
MAPTLDQRRPMLQLGTHLSAKQLAALRAELETLRSFRADQLIQLAHPETGGPFASADDEVARTLRTGARSAFHAVQAALWRMDEGTYGLCTNCTAEVDVALLRAVPHTAFCLACQQEAPAG